MKNCDNCTPARRIPSQPGPCRGTQRRPGRRRAVALGKIRGREKLPPRVESRESGGLDGVPPPCWGSHLSENKKRKTTPRNNRLGVIPRIISNPAAAAIPPPEIIQPPSCTPLTDAAEAACRDHRHDTPVPASGADVHVAVASNRNRGRGPLKIYSRTILAEHWELEECSRPALMQLMPRSWPVGDLALESVFPTGGNLAS